MQHLRTRVDQIDLEILRLLQQRTKLSRRIGDTKRRHRAVVYVPERERDLLRRVNRLSRGKLPPRAITAIFREILSSSRAAQGQGAIGLLQGSAPAIMASARWCFGACDEFSAAKAWPELHRHLMGGKFALALLTSNDLAGILQTPKGRRGMTGELAIVGDFAAGAQVEAAANERIYIVTPQGAKPSAEADRILILIECKSTDNAVKTWLKSMAKPSLQSESIALPATAGALLVRLAGDKAKLREALGALRLAAVPFSMLGAYRGTDDYAG
jgi:chorismate mutase